MPVVKICDRMLSCCVTLLLLLLPIAEQSGSDPKFPLVKPDYNANCSYQINFPVANSRIGEVFLLGLYFFKLSLSEGTSLNVSYSWKGNQYTDNWSFNGTISVSSRSDPILKCFENDEKKRKLFWSDTPIDISYNGNGANESCPGYELGYKAMYWAETCNQTIQVGPAFASNGTVMFPSQDAFYPCNLSCSWKLEIANSGNQQYIGIILRSLLSEPPNDNLTVVGTDSFLETTTTCRIDGSSTVGESIYLGKLGQTVTITFKTDSGVNSKGFKIDYVWLAGIHDIYGLTPCNKTRVGSVGYSCHCVNTTSRPTEQITRRFRKTLLDEQPENQIVIAFTNASSIISCIQCANEETTSTSYKTLPYSTANFNTSSSVTVDTTYETVSSTTARSIADDLADLKDNITIHNVGEKMSNLSDILSNINGTLTPQNVIDAVDALAAAANISGISSDAGFSFDVCADLVLQKGNKSFTPRATKTLLGAVHNYGINVNLTVGQSSEYYNGSSFVNIVTVVDCGEPEFQVGLLDNNGSLASPILNTMTVADDSLMGSLALIRIAPEVVCINRQKRETNSTDTETTRVSFQVYRTTNIFLPENDTSNNSLEESFCGSTVMVGDVAVSATVIERNDNSSAPPPMAVQIGFRSTLSSDNQKFSRNFKTDCAYWSEDWIVNDQVELISKTGDNYLFQANHLTDFTLLVSNNPKDPIFCETGLSVLGTVGASCSFIGLTAVTVSLVAIRLLGLSNSPIVLLCLFFNLCFALFFLCFVLFSDQETLQLSDSLCTAFAAVMYYLLMSTMVWTCCRAVLVYKRYVVVFETGRHSKLFSFNRVSTFISIVLPFIVILIVGLTNDSFFQRSDFFCWINPAYSNYAVIIPISLMLIVSIIVLILVVRSVFFVGKTADTHAYRSKGSVKKDFRRKIWVVFVIQISLGLPWIFLYMTEIPGTSLFHYLFTITNAFQGVLIAALHFYERRKDIRKLIGRMPRLKITWPSQRPNHSIVTLDSPLDSPVNSPKASANAKAIGNNFALSAKPLNTRLNDIQQSETKLTQRKLT